MVADRVIVGSGSGEAGTGLEGTAVSITGFGVGGRQAVDAISRTNTNKPDLKDIIPIITLWGESIHYPKPLYLSLLITENWILITVYRLLVSCSLVKQTWLGYNLRHTGRGAARLARLHGVQEVPGSNPGAPTINRPAKSLRILQVYLINPCQTEKYDDNLEKICGIIILA